MFVSVLANFHTFCSDISTCSQSILQTGSFDRDELEEIESEMSQKTRLWRGIQTFEERLETWENTSFEALDIESMEAEIIRYEIIGDTGASRERLGQPRRRVT